MSAVRFRPEPLLQINISMAVVAKWLTHQIVALALVGSIPINRPIHIFAGVV
ncbi:conserved hypothetical protein [Bacillus altitudinis]|nr:conserved hypothetical protein [Bacillus altitudinis]